MLTKKKGRQNRATPCPSCCAVHHRLAAGALAAPFRHAQPARVSCSGFFCARFQTATAFLQPRLRLTATRTLLAVPLRAACRAFLTPCEFFARPRSVAAALYATCGIRSLTPLLSPATLLQRLCCKAVTCCCALAAPFRHAQPARVSCSGFFCARFQTATSFLQPRLRLTATRTLLAVPLRAACRAFLTPCEFFARPRSVAAALYATCGIFLSPTGLMSRPRRTASGSEETITSVLSCKESC